MLRLLPLLLFSTLCGSLPSNKIGINYGQLGNNLPSASKSIDLIRNLKAGRVKIYDANPEILKALAGTNLEVSIMVPNDQIIGISGSQSLADKWIEDNLLPFYQKVHIRYLLVGNEILTDYGNKNTWTALVPAMIQLKKSLRKHNIKNVKVGTTLAMDMLVTFTPPSNATFRDDIQESVMKPMLQFLNQTKSYLFADVYTYFPWAADPTGINLKYALLQKSGAKYKDPESGHIYRNLLDQMLDGIYAAMAKMGYPQIKILIAETGWPSGGDIEQIGCNIRNAATYNRNLVRKLLDRQSAGTPARPSNRVRAFIFSLYNENQKPGPGTERNWGLLYPDGSPVYDVDLTGKKKHYSPLPSARNNRPYNGNIWCIVSSTLPKGPEMQLQDALNYACQQVNKSCDAIQPKMSCDGTLLQRASYAFNAYWTQFRASGGTCYFNGLAAQTTKNPSYKSCKFPSINPSNRT